ncbi:MAG TPA: SulP family inorganic anion transporter [Gemmatimonadales bacterium]|nr:SulP family inorganic anion transporter [Gemmatimonadales bacterium]
MLVPKLVTTLKDYSRAQFVTDLTAGIIVGIVALPLAIAFGIASGVAPEAGLVTAIVAGLIISTLGGSRVQIGGPTGAFVVIVYGVVERYGVAALAVATLMAGVILVALGLARLGGAIKFIPFPVVTGFTAGIALVIFAGQIKDLFGLAMGPPPAEFVEKWRSYAAHAGSVNPAALTVAALALAIVVLWPRVSRRIPAPFVALVVTTALVQLANLPVETIGTRFGEIQARFPAWHLPAVSWETMRQLVPPAITIALLGAIESLLSAVVADGMIGGRHRSNMELVAQGVANIASPLFGGIPATGAIARTATNVRNGGRTPVAGIVHALTLLGILLFAGRWAALIPMATLAAILVVVSYHMSEWRTFAAELRSAPKSDVIVLLLTFGLTVLIDLTVAVQVGLVCAAFLFMKRMSEVANVSAISREFGDDQPVDTPLYTKGRTVPPGVQIYAIDGPFFFGAAEKFKETLSEVAGKPRVVVLLMRNVSAIDSTGLRALQEVIRRFRAGGSEVLLVGIHAQPMVAMVRAGVVESLGEHNLVDTIDEALTRARAVLDRRQSA